MRGTAPGLIGKESMDRLLWAAAPLGCAGKRGKEDDGDYSVGMGPLGDWLCRAVLQAPAPRVCGTPGGPPVTAPRVRLADGRHLAYEESGVPKERARYKIVFSHGFTGSRLDSLRASPVSHISFFFFSFKHFLFRCWRCSGLRHGFRVSFSVWAGCAPAILV